MDMRSVLCAQMWVRAVHMRHKEVCTRVDVEGQKKLSVTLPRSGIEPRVFCLNFDSLPTELYSPVPEMTQNMYEHAWSSLEEMTLRREAQICFNLCT